MTKRPYDWFGAGLTGFLSSLFNGSGAAGAAAGAALDLNRQRAALDEAARIADTRAEDARTQDTEGSERLLPPTDRTDHPT